MNKIWRKSIQSYQGIQRKKFFDEYITNSSYEYIAKSKSVVCCECGVSFASGKAYSISFNGGKCDLHMDHITPLAHLVKDFCFQKGISIQDAEKNFSFIQMDWISYHNKNAIVKPIHEICHKWKTKGQQQKNMF